MIKEWKLEKSTVQSKNRVFSLRVDESISPDNGKRHNFYVIDAPDWVNMIAVTDDMQILLIRQFRHGIGKITVEIPGGMVDAGEDPFDSAKRELLEETGYSSENWGKIGELEPNPAIMSNRCHVYLAQGCRKVSEPSFDGTENIETFLSPESEVKQLILDGDIKHSLVIAAFNFYFLGR